MHLDAVQCPSVAATAAAPADQAAGTCDTAQDLHPHRHGYRGPARLSRRSGQKTVPKHPAIQGCVLGDVPS